MKLVVHGDPPGRTPDASDRLVSNQTLSTEGRERKLSGAERLLSGRFDKDREMHPLSLKVEHRATFGRMTIDPVVISDGEDVEFAGLVKSKHSLDRFMGNGSIVIDKNRFEVPREPLERGVIKVGHDRLDYLMHPQNGVAPPHRHLVSEVLLRFLQVLHRPDEGVGGDSVREIAVAERLEGDFPKPHFLGVCGIRRAELSLEERECLVEQGIAGRLNQVFNSARGKNGQRLIRVSDGRNPPLGEGLSATAS